MAPTRSSRQPLRRSKRHWHDGYRPRRRTLNMPVLIIQAWQRRVRPRARRLGGEWRSLAFTEITSARPGLASGRARAGGANLIMASATVTPAGTSPIRDDRRDPTRRRLINLVGSGRAIERGRPAPIRVNGNPCLPGKQIRAASAAVPE